MLAHSLFSGITLVNFRKSQKGSLNLGMTEFIMSPKTTQILLKKAIVYVCLLIHINLMNSGPKKKKKNHIQTHISPPQPLPHSSGGFCLFYCSGFFLSWFFFLLPYYQIKGNGCYLRFQKLGFRDLSLVIYSLGQVI